VNYADDCCMYLRYKCYTLCKDSAIQFVWIQ